MLSLRFLQRRALLKSLLLSLLFLLGGCAEPTRILRPADFALHATDHPFFDLHWRLERETGVVLAVGLVEATRQGGIGEVTLELQGVDKSGKVVSRSRASTYGGPFLRWDSRPFVVRLRPTGQEDRFELKVWGFTWESGRNGRGRGR